MVSLETEMMRGYFGIGILNTKTPQNLGTLWRSAFTFNAAFIFTVAKRYPQQGSDTMKAWRHIPLHEYATTEAFWDAVPCECEVVAVEQHPRAKMLSEFKHSDRAIYLLGAEDRGISETELARCQRVVQIDSRFCLNVAVAGSIVMWHRQEQFNRS